MQYSQVTQFKMDTYKEKNSWGKATGEFYSTKSPNAYTFKVRNLTTGPLKLAIVGMCFACANNQLASTFIKTIYAFRVTIIHFVYWQTFLLQFETKKKM